MTNRTNKMKYCVAICSIAALFLAGSAWAEPTEKQLKAMGLFLSNFTELGFMDVHTKDMVLSESYPNLVRFGIWHNYVNNFKSRIKHNEEGNRENGDLRIKASWVEESVQKYFGLEFKADKSVDQSDPPYFLKDGYFYFWGADGEAPWFARVLKASNPDQGFWEVSGEIYNADDPEEILGDFQAILKEASWKTKQTYLLVEMYTDFR